MAQGRARQRLASQFRLLPLAEPFHALGPVPSWKTPSLRRGRRWPWAWLLNARRPGPGVSACVGGTGRAAARDGAFWTVYHRRGHRHHWGWLLDMKVLFWISAPAGGVIGTHPFGGPCGPFRCSNNVWVGSRAVGVLSKWDQNAIRQGGGDRAYVLTGTWGETLRTSSARLGGLEGFVKRWLLRIVMAVELNA